MRTWVSVLLAGSLGLGLTGPAGATTLAPPRPMQSFTFSADCVDIPGRLSVHEERAGEDRFTVALQGTGLPTGLDRGEIFWLNDEGYPRDEWFDIDPSARQIRQHATIPLPLTGSDVDGYVRDDDTEETCLVMGVAESFAISIGLINSASLRVSLPWHEDAMLSVDGLDCRGAQDPTGWAVVSYPDRTDRIRLNGRGCDRGQMRTIHVELEGHRLPRAVRVVLHSGGRAWRVAYGIGY